MVAQRDRARLWSAGRRRRNIGHGAELPEDRSSPPPRASRCALGTFDDHPDGGRPLPAGPVSRRRSTHRCCPPVRASALPLRRGLVDAGGSSGQRAHGCWWSAALAFVPGALAGQRAEVVYLGVGQLGLQPERYLVDYWTETVRTVGARRVVLIHWDDFFRPADRPLRALPYAGDDLDVSMRVLTATGRPRTASRRTCPPCGSRRDPWSWTLALALGRPGWRCSWFSPWCARTACRRRSWPVPGRGPAASRRVSSAPPTPRPR